MSADEGEITHTSILANFHREKDGTFNVLAAGFFRVAGSGFLDDHGLHDSLRHANPFGERVCGRLITEMYLTYD